MINWKVRLKQKWFWAAMVSAVLVLIQRILVIFGISVDFATLEGQIIAVIEAVFMILTILGIVVDPTTDGVGDSEQALSYTEPKTDGE